MTDNNTLAIEVAAPDGETFFFVERTAAIAYAASERAKWNWLAQQNTIREYGGVLSPLFEIIGSLDKVLGEASAVRSVASDEVIANGLRAYVGWTPAVHDRAPLQGHLLQIVERSAKEALWTLGWLAYRAARVKNLENLLNSYWNSPGFLTGMTSAWAWADRGLGGDAAASIAARIEQNADESQKLRDRTATIVNEVQTASAAIKELAESGQHSTREVEQRLEAFATALDGRLAEIVEERSSDLEKKWRELTTTYEESLKLKAPARYWGIKQKAHRKLASNFAWASGLFAAVGGFAMCFGFFRLMENVAAGSVLPPWRDILPSAVLALVFLWTLRTLLRMTMSHVHLSIDAGERRVMVECYLAMTHKGETTGEERGALFAAIFRSSGDGIVKDETPPIPMWEMLKATKGKD